MIPSMVSSERILLREIAISPTLVMFQSRRSEIFIGPPLVRSTRCDGKGKAIAGSASPPPRRVRSRPPLDDLLVAPDQAVAHVDDAPGVGRDVRLVGDQDDGLAGVVELLEDADDLLRGARVEVAGGLVGEQDRRVGDQGAGDGHPLLLAAGELRGVVVLAAGEPDPREGRARRGGRARGSRGRGRRRAAAARRSRSRAVRASRLKLWKTKPILALRISRPLRRGRGARRRCRRAGRCPRSAGRGSR